MTSIVLLALSVIGSNAALQNSYTYDELGAATLVVRCDYCGIVSHVVQGVCDIDVTEEGHYAVYHQQTRTSDYQHLLDLGWLSPGTHTCMIEAQPSACGKEIVLVAIGETQTGLSTRSPITTIAVPETKFDRRVVIGAGILVIVSVVVLLVLRLRKSKQMTDHEPQIGPSTTKATTV
eukprot:255332_1